MTRVFEMSMIDYPKNSTQFTPDTAPDWLTGKGAVKGSTMDMRWFWVDRVMGLSVGESVNTEFRTIKRLR